MPPKVKSCTATWSYFDHGYGTPVRALKCSIMSAVRPSERHPSASRPGSTRDRAARPVAGRRAPTTRW
jgi:hypothetical protein